MYQLCTQYHIDYSISVQRFFFTFLLLFLVWKRDFLASKFDDGMNDAAIDPMLRNMKKKTKQEKGHKRKEWGRVGKYDDKTFAQQVLRAHFTNGLNYTLYQITDWFFLLIFCVHFLHCWSIDWRQASNSSLRWGDRWAVVRNSNLKLWSIKLFFKS